MSADSKRSEDHELLLLRLNRIGRPLSVLVGAPLSVTHGEPPRGVPNVAAMIERVRKSLTNPGELDRLEAALHKAGAAEQYQTAFSVAGLVGGQDVVNGIIRNAVLEAREPGTPALAESDDAGEPNDWHLPRGTRALGELAVQHPERLGGPILTTNFDPLISMAIHRAGDENSYTRLVLEQDGGLGSSSDHRTGIQVVHLHGYWSGDTRHSAHHLKAARPQLVASLRSVLRNQPLLVAAYGGWEDAFMEALWQVLAGLESPVEVLWTFFGPEASVRHERRDLLARFDKYQKVTPYYEIDAHNLFEDMLAQAKGSTTAGTRPGSSTATLPSSAPSSTYSHDPDVDDLDLVDALTHVLDASADLTGAMAGPNAQRGRALADEILAGSDLYSVAHPFKLGMEHLARRDGSAALARKLKSVFERAIVDAGAETAEKLGSDADGIYMLDVGPPPAIEPTVASASGRQVNYWRVGAQHWPTYLVGPKNGMKPPIERGMDANEHLVSIKAEIVDEIDDLMEMPHDAENLADLEAELSRKLAAHTAWRLDEHQQSCFYTVVPGGDDSMLQYAKLLAQKVPLLRVILSVGSSPRQGWFCAVLNSVYDAFDQTQKSR